VRLISRRALLALKTYDWPGNVREFAHAIQSAVMLTDGEEVDIGALPEQVGRGATDSIVAMIESEEPGPLPTEPVGAAASANSDSQAPLLLDEVIKNTLMRSLEETEGNRRRAADLLGISRSTLYRMLARYGLEEEASGRRRPSQPLPNGSGHSGF
jgi:DNA-binding NtrC family response regulator